MDFHGFSISMLCNFQDCTLVGCISESISTSTLKSDRPFRRKITWFNQRKRRVYIYIYSIYIFHIYIYSIHIYIYIPYIYIYIYIPCQVLFVICQEVYMKTTLCIFHSSLFWRTPKKKTTGSAQLIIVGGH